MAKGDNRKKRRRAEFLEACVQQKLAEWDVDEARKALQKVDPEFVIHIGRLRSEAHHMAYRRRYGEDA